MTEPGFNVSSNWREFFYCNISEFNTEGIQKKKQRKMRLSILNKRQTAGLGEIGGERKRQTKKDCEELEEIK